MFAIVFLGALPALAITRLADKLGRKQLLIWSVFGYTVCSHRDDRYPQLTVPRTLLWENSCRDFRGAFSGPILNCQVKIKGKLTVWGQQHDEVTLAPAGARAYELPSLTGNESAGLTLLLMEIEKPSQRIRDSIATPCAARRRSQGSSSSLPTANATWTGPAPSCGAMTPHRCTRC